MPREFGPLTRAERFRDLSILVGAVSRALPLPETVWREVIEERLPRKFVKVNLRAFELGRALQA